MKKERFLEHHVNIYQTNKQTQMNIDTYLDFQWPVFNVVVSRYNSIGVL